MAVYLAGIVLRQRVFLHQKSLMRFHDGLAWIMQITMFLTLGLLVFPSRLVPIMGVGLLIAGFLMFVARPISIFISLLPGRSGWREKTFISWVGLRGAAPIILATFPLLAQLEQANLIFNVIFFVVLTSVLLQGTSLERVAKWLKIDTPTTPNKVYPIEYVPMQGLKSELKELPVPAASGMNGKAIFELGLPDDFLVVLVARKNDFLLPKGGTVLEANDTLLVLADKKSFDDVIEKFSLGVDSS
ncbi:MAG: cation:proton antiporter [Anaerolineaceae bacterium]|nr:cation:proton antiporter [Anaerolineaceae bacterium]